MVIIIVFVSVLSYLKCYFLLFYKYIVYICIIILVKNVVEINGFLEVIIIFIVIFFIC